MAVQEDIQSHDALDQRRFRPLYVLFPALIAAVVLAVYYGVWRLPFVQDDWVILNAIRETGGRQWLLSEFNPAGRLLYRPLGMAYFLANYKLFGLNPIGFHAIGLLLLVCNSLLVAHVTQRILKRRDLAAAAGVIFAAAVGVQMDPLLWMSGIFDLAGMFFFLASFALFLHNRPVLSAAALLAGVLFKEAIVVLPVILFLYVLLERRPGSPLREAIRRLWPHAVVMAAYLAVKSTAISPASLPADSPYKMKLLGLHLLANPAYYGMWGFEAVTPFRQIRAVEALAFAVEPPRLTMVYAAGLLVIAAVAAVLIFSRKNKHVMLLVGWFVLGLATTLLLTNHAYRYYMTYSLPALILLTLLGLQALLERLKLSEQVFRATLIALCAANVATAAIHFHGRLAAGMDEKAASGTNRLIAKASSVHAVQSYLLTSHPQIPHDTTIVTRGADVWALGKEAAPRMWYRDSSIRLYDAASVASDASGLFAEDKEESPWISRGSSYGRTDLDPRKTICLIVRRGSVREVPLKDFQPQP